MRIPQLEAGSVTPMYNSYLFVFLEPHEDHIGRLCGVFGPQLQPQAAVLGYLMAIVVQFRFNLILLMYLILQENLEDIIGIYLIFAHYYFSLNYLCFVSSRDFSREMQRGVKEEKTLLASVVLHRCM